MATRASSFRSGFRTATDHAVTGLAILATLLVIAPLVAIFVYLLIKGASSLNLDFFIKNPVPEGESGGGMANAIVGSGVLLGIASLIGVPIGIGAGIYLAEFGRGTKLANAIRFTADVLNGVPSIVMGLAAYSLIVIPQGHFSAFSGGVAPGNRMMDSYGCANLGRDAADGAKTTFARLRWDWGCQIGARCFRSRVKTASPGIITGCMLAFARVAGETAPLIFTALQNSFWSTNPNREIASLPVQIWLYATGPYEDQHRLAWAGAVVLIGLIVIAVSLVRYVTSRGVLKGAS